MKAIISIIFLFLSVSLGAQSIERQVIGSTGGTFSSSSLTVTSTVGENSVSTYSGSFTLTQGYQQADTNNSTSIQELSVKANYALYPNPTIGNSNLSITVEHINATIQIEIYSTTGKLISVIPKSLIAGIKSNIPLNLTNQAAGVYFIKIKDAQNHLSKTLRIIKQ